MNFGLPDLFMAIVSWVHAVSAAAWIGGSIVFAFVFRPAARLDPDAIRRVMAPVSSLYRELVDLAAIAIVVSGVMLSFDRLTSRAADPFYASVLAVKVALALLMFYAVWATRKSGRGAPPRGRWLSKLSWLLGYNAIVALGLIVYFLADVLAGIFQANLRAG